uniref:Uncharacterized protein n=1 Tax=Anopheles atroparvus TaxID=41427 RepID=A0A182ISR4_ANOAO
MSDDQVERKRQRWRKAYADRRAAETADQRAVRLAAERARRIQDNEATERRLERRRQAYADPRAVETADQRAMHLGAERTRRARKRQQTTEATEPEQQPDQGPVAGPSRVQEPRVLPRPALASVAARSPVVVETQAGRIPALDQRRYNRPTSDEVAGIFIVPPGGSITYGRDLVVQERHTLHLKQVFEQNQMFDTMQYPLLHPCGEVGWSIGILDLHRYLGANQRITTVSDSVATAADDGGAEEGNGRRVTILFFQPTESCCQRTPMSIHLLTYLLLC